MDLKTAIVYGCMFPDIGSDSVNLCGVGHIDIHMVVYSRTGAFHPLLPEQALHLIQVDTAAEQL